MTLLTSPESLQHPRQLTLSSAITCSGVALHSGDTVVMNIRPAEVNTGIVFVRTDVGTERGIVPARYDLVSETTLGTTLRNEFGVTIATVEHLMAALAGAEIDNAVIEMDGPEVPIMDGSSEPFVFLLECAGTVEQDAPKRFIEVLKPVSVRDGDCVASLEPHADGFVLDITIEFAHQAIGRQHAVYDFTTTSFKQSLCRARTFGFVREVEKMHSMGLALGGSLKNAIVVGDEGVVNEEGLRYQDEFVRHKALDCVGDYYLAGASILGRATTTKPGHGVNNKLIRALFADASNYRIVGDEHAVLPSLAARAMEYASA